MIIKIQKWGNSLALRIPKPFITELNIKQNSLVTLSLQEGKLIIEPASEEKYKLNDLLSRVKEDNIHQEYSYGKSVGKEIW